MESKHRLSRHSLQQIGQRAVQVYYAVLLLLLAGVLVSVLLGKFPLEVGTPFAVDYFLILAALGAITLWWFKWLLWLHEGAHLGYACFHGVPCDHVGYIAETGQPGVGASLTFTDVPKDVWVGLTLAPLIIPLILLVLSPFYLPVGLFALLILPSSFNDLVYVFTVLRTPGRFVTTTAEEVIVSQHPLSNASKSLSG